METINNQRLSEIKTGWGFLISSKGFLPDKIQAFQSIRYGRAAGEWNHAGVFQKTTDGVLRCVEMEREGLVKNALLSYIVKQAKGDCEILILKPKFGVYEIPAVNIIEESIGKIRYEFFNLLLYQAIKCLSGKYIGVRGNRAAKRMICGEWMAFFYYQLTGMKEFKTWYDEAPAEMYLNDLFEHKLFKP